MITITFRTDYENNAEDFWEYVNEPDAIHDAPISDEARAAITPFLTESGVDSVTVSDKIARELLDWFETVPGWDDGPSHAPHPVTWDD